MSHTCQAIVFHCIDWRLAKGLEEWLRGEKLYEAGFDRVSVAGAVKSLTQPEEGRDREYLLKQIEISSRLHGISRVLLVNHTDCGAYGGSSAHGSPEAEAAAHAQELAKAAAMVKERFPALVVETYLARLSEAGHAWEVAVEST